jgi:protein SFI1
MKRLTATPTCQTIDLESLRFDTPVPAKRVDHISDDDNSQLSPLLLGVPVKRLSAHVNHNSLVNKSEAKAKALKDFDFSIPTPIRANRPVPPSLTADTDSRGRISPVPPSYKSTPFASVLPIAQRTTSELNHPNSVHNVVLPIKQAASQPKERINLDDAWKNIKMEQDEKYADNFRNDMLLTRCWEIWRQGFQWIMVSVPMMRNENGQT